MSQCGINYRGYLIPNNARGSATVIWEVGVRNRRVTLLSDSQAFARRDQRNQDELQTWCYCVGLCPLYEVCFIYTVIGCILRFKLASSHYKVLTNILLFTYFGVVIHPPTTIKTGRRAVSILSAALNDQFRNIKVGNAHTRQLYVFLKPREVLKPIH
jgi:hypothetical protein